MVFKLLCKGDSSLLKEVDSRRMIVNREIHVPVRICQKADEDDLNLFASDGNITASTSESSSWTWQPALFIANIGSKPPRVGFERVKCPVLSSIQCCDPVVLQSV